MRRWICVLVLGLTSAPVAWAAPPGASAWSPEEAVRLRLISATSTVGEAGSVLVGLHFVMDPGWKVYWRTPGDAGYPPQVDWRDSRNLAATEIAWPGPQRFFEFGGLATHGYDQELVLPVRARLAEPGRPLALRAAVTYVACDEVCIPFETSLALDLPTGTPSVTAFDPLISTFVDKVPRPPGPQDPRLGRAEVVGSGADRRLQVVAYAGQEFKAPDLFVEAPDPLYVGPPDVDVVDGGRKAVFRMVSPDGRDSTPLAGTPITVTLIDGARAIQQVLVPEPAVAGATLDYRALAVILALSFVGGLVLNLMPCVLPVLSLKVMGVIGMAGLDRGRIAARFFATAAGIMVSFLVLAAATSGLKATGATVGWGVQFQQPIFLVVLVMILTLFAANLWGLFEFRLPSFASSLGASSLGASNRGASNGGARGHGAAGGISEHFASGAFATLLATPCSAPFLGTAIGFALARGVGEIFAVFTALGIGMAFPFLLLAVFPGFAVRLPRPGPWMMKLKVLLGLLLALTTLWLLSVLTVQMGPQAAVAVGLLMAVAIGALGLVSRSDSRGRRALGVALAAIAALALLVPDQLGRSPSPAKIDGAVWQPFDSARIAEHVAAGKTVFVDVTADWCITCQVNKAAVLERGAVAERLAGEAVIAMRADWTSRDPEIADYLERFGRFGIPFNAVFGPALPRGYVLPELLTESTVLAAFDRAGSTLTSAK